MFLKKDKPTDGSLRSNCLRSMSITAKLTLLFTLSGLGVLILSCGFLYWVLTTHRQKEDDVLIREKTYRLQTALKNWNVDSLKKEMSSSPEFHSLAFSFRILDEKGRLLLETPGMGDAVPVSAFPASYEALTELAEGTEWKSRTGKVFLLLATRIEVLAPLSEKAIIQTAYDVTGDYALIAHYGWKLLVVFIFGTLFFLVLGNAVAGSGLRPLRKMADRVEKVTATHLNERIAEKEWPKELRSLAASFDRMLNRLDDSFVRLSHFSSALAHELRTPINTLMGEAGVALSRARTQEEYRSVIESSIEEYERLSRLVENLLFLARAENPEAGIKCSVFDVGDELNKICDYYEEIGEEQRIAITCSGKGFLTADRALLRQAICNLFSNALRYTPSGGKVDVSISQPDEGSFEIVVSDTGSGIDPEHLPYVFNRFYQAAGNTAHSDYSRGSGLGLAIVKSIMDLHGGTATIRSEPENGTAVTLSFPISPCRT